MNAHNGDINTHSHPQSRLTLVTILTYMSGNSKRLLEIGVLLNSGLRDISHTTAVTGKTLDVLHSVDHVSYLGETKCMLPQEKF